MTKTGINVILEISIDAGLFHETVLDSAVDIDYSTILKTVDIPEPSRNDIEHQYYAAGPTRRKQSPLTPNS
ncbi:hypothetical protein [Paeniglutamicibacter kerguelensis]|uniref:Uncharacterized protein n=1 Tax=Paeniglutamicibacter kerguelensis TaxID=254788 RepID=A0ABS4X8B7_9MICC|nr:hypothetical protein [Paeniglutamicibacter kerguelensis]MBP2384715.1 hypothetical protein [Paeniglutamicibacter kerguelensis]